MVVSHNRPHPVALWEARSYVAYAATGASEYKELAADAGAGPASPQWRTGTLSTKKSVALLMGSTLTSRYSGIPPLELSVTAPSAPCASSAAQTVRLAKMRMLSACVKVATVHARKIRTGNSYTQMTSLTRWVGLPGLKNPFHAMQDSNRKFLHQMISLTRWAGLLAGQKNPFHARGWAGTKRRGAREDFHSPTFYHEGVTWPIAGAHSMSIERPYPRERTRRRILILEWTVLSVCVHM